MEFIDRYLRPSRTFHVDETGMIRVSPVGTAQSALDGIVGGLVRVGTQFAKGVLWLTVRVSLLLVVIGFIAAIVNGPSSSTGGVTPPPPNVSGRNL